MEAIILKLSVVGTPQERPGQGQGQFLAGEGGVWAGPALRLHRAITEVPTTLGLLRIACSLLANWLWSDAGARQPLPLAIGHWPCPSDHSTSVPHGPPGQPVAVGLAKQCSGTC